MPLKTRPSMSRDTASWSGWPKKRMRESARLMPADASNSCTTARSPLTSSTLQRRVLPSERTISASSSYVTPCTWSTTIRGPEISRMVLYSRIILLSLLSQRSRRSALPSRRAGSHRRPYTGRQARPWRVRSSRARGWRRSSLKFPPRSAALRHCVSYWRIIASMRACRSYSE